MLKSIEKESLSQKEQQPNKELSQMSNEDNNYFNSFDKTSFKKVRQNLLRIWQALKDKPLNLIMVSSGIFILSYFIFAGSKPTQHAIEKEEDFSSENSSQMHGIKEAVDPRDAWVNRIESKIDESIQSIKEEYESTIQEKDTKILELEQNFNNQLRALRESVLENEARRGSVGTNNNSNEQIHQSRQKPSLKIGYVKRQTDSRKKDMKDYAPSGSHARAVLLTGLAVGTGTNSSSSPEPIVLRLTDSSLFALGHKTEQLQEATLIGDCSGDISSERAKCRLQTLSLKNRKGEIIEKPVEGWVIGEDGRAGIKGVVVDKSSNVARAAVLSGVLGGISQFFENQSTKGIFPLSAITGQTNALKPSDAIKGGAFAGAGNAMEKLAEYAIARAESMSPVIMVASGREVDIVFRKGVDLNEDGISTTVNTQVRQGAVDSAVDKFGGEQEIIGGSSNFSRSSRLPVQDSSWQNQSEERSNEAALAEILKTNNHSEDFINKELNLNTRESNILDNDTPAAIENQAIESQIESQTEIQGGF